MLDSIKLHLTYLLQAGYTHHDLKSIFSSYDLFDPIKLWNDTLLKKVDHSINRDRQEKIYIKSHTIYILSFEIIVDFIDFDSMRFDIYFLLTISVDTMVHFF